MTKSILYGNSKQDKIPTPDNPQPIINKYFIPILKNKMEVDKMNIDNTILDLKLFKEQLESHNLLTDELADFIDYYMKFYNKE